MSNYLIVRAKSVTLTQEGISFFADAQLILKTAVSAKERLGKHERFIPFELGCHNYTEMNLFPPCLKRTVPGISSAPSFHTNDSIPFYSGNGRKYPADGSSGHKNMDRMLLLCGTESFPAPLWPVSARQNIRWPDIKPLQ